MDTPSGSFGSSIRLGSWGCLPGQTTPRRHVDVRPEYALENAAWKLMGRIAAIESIYNRRGTGAGNHGVMACHSGLRTISNTGASCDPCICLRMLCWDVS